MLEASRAAWAKLAAGGKEHAYPRCSQETRRLEFTFRPAITEVQDEAA